MKQDDDREVSIMSVCAVPQKTPYIAKIKKGSTVDKTLKSTSSQMKKSIKDSSDKLNSVNIRKGWDE